MDLFTTQISTHYSAGEMSVGSQGGSLLNTETEKLMAQSYSICTFNTSWAKNIS